MDQILSSSLTIDGRQKQGATGGTSGPIILGSCQCSYDSIYWRHSIYYPGDGIFSPCILSIEYIYIRYPDIL